MMSLQPGQLLQARYRVAALLGQGGMGAVYRAWDTRLDVPVALKEMTSQPGLDAATLAQLRQQFQQEAVVVARLVHPHLVRVTDFFEEGDNVYLVMNFVAGESLADLIRRVGAVPEEQVLTWAASLLDALAYCHSQGVIHRDIKPQNVIIQPNGQPVLVDFGLVKLWNPQEARTRTAMRGLGTPEYAPPEQYDTGGHTDPRSDLYSLAATLYHALTGQVPPTATQRIVNPAVLQPVRRWNPQVSPATEAILWRALELRPEARYQSAREMRAALPVRSATSALPPSPPPTPPLCYVPAPPQPPAPPPRPPSRPVWLWIGGLGVLLFLGLLIVMGVVVRGFTKLSQATPGLTAVAQETPTLQVVPPVEIGSISTTPEAVATETASPTASAEPTATQMPTSTSQPPATTQPAATWTPTNTPPPPCPAVTGPFAAAWQTYQAWLGCAAGQAQSVTMAQERFEQGQMFWRSDNHKILVLYHNGRWARYNDLWQEGDPAFSCADSAPSSSPPTPARGFGKIWCTYSEVRQGLGNALEAEHGFEGGTVQDFEQGLILRTNVGETYILLGNGTWTQ